MINLELKVEEANLVLQALSELPAKISMNLIANIQQQAGPQVQASAEEAAEEPAVVQ